MKANTQTTKRWCINILFTILTFTGNEFKTTGKRVQGESTECYIKEDGEKAKEEEEEEEEKWISTSNHLVKTSTDGSISPSLLLSVSLSLSLMLSFCLALTDLLRGRDQNESPAPFSLHPSLSPLLHRLTASPPSLPLSLLLVPWPEPIFFSPGEKIREIEDEKGEAERMNVFLSVPVASFREDSSLLTHTDASLSSLLHAWSCLFLSSFERCALSANFTEGGLWFCSQSKKKLSVKCHPFICPTDALCCIQKNSHCWQTRFFLNHRFPGATLPVTSLLEYCCHIFHSTSLFFPQCRWERWRNGTVQLIQSMNMGNIL